MVIIGMGFTNWSLGAKLSPDVRSSSSANAVKDNVEIVAMQNKIVKKTFWIFFI